MGGFSALKYRAWRQNQASRNSPPDPPDPADPADPADRPEVVSSTAARSLPSTRAGGQDDCSLTNSHKKINEHESASQNNGKQSAEPMCAVREAEIIVMDLSSTFDVSSTG